MDELTSRLHIAKKKNLVNWKIDLENAAQEREKNERESKKYETQNKKV